jgi:hypothetical protein
MKMQKKVIVLIGLPLFLANASFAQEVKTDYDRAASKPRTNGASKGNGIWTNDKFERLSDHRPVSFVGQITEEVTDAAAGPTPHVTPPIRIMSMFERHLLNPDDKETMEKVLFQ